VVDAVYAVGARSEGGIATALWTITRERQAVHSCLLTHQARLRQGSAYRNRHRVACVKAWCRIPWHHVDAAEGSTQSWHFAHVKFSPSLNTTLPQPHDSPPTATCTKNMFLPQNLTHYLHSHKINS
jgi:hypothetical protein